MPRILSCLLLLIAAICGLASAQTPKCQNDGTSRDAGVCAEERARAADLRLNQTYRRVLLTVSKQDDGGASTKAALIQAQRFWIQYRDADCEGIYQHWNRAGMRDYFHFECMATRTEQRIRELEEYERSS